MLFDTVKCTGCRACEMACSMHHKGVFSPSYSSIKVTQEDEKYKIAVNYDQKISPPCNECRDETEKACLKYCTPFVRDELAKILVLAKEARE